MAIQKHTLPDTTSAIWAETENLNYFTKTAITPDSAGDVTNKTTDVAAHTRRQYPGDSSKVSVSSSSRVFMHDPGRKSGSAIPGSPFVISDGTETRQMRFTGTWTDVHSFFVGNTNAECSLYSPTGTRYVIAAAEAVTLTKSKPSPSPSAS